MEGTAFYFYFFQAIWFPNIIYVEEPVFEPFLNILRFAVQMHNNAVGNCVPPVDIITEKENDGFEVCSLKNLDKMRSFNIRFINFNFCFCNLGDTLTPSVFILLLDHKP